MEINVYKGLPGLPSIDFDCLRVLSYIKLTQAPVKIIHNGNPKNSNNGFLPYLTHEGAKFSGYKDVVDHLKKQGFDINKTLSNNDVFISEGLMVYTFTKINPAFQYIFWGNPQNVSNTSLLYATQIRFPFNMFYPKKYITKAYGILEVMSDIDLEDKINNKEVEDVIFAAKSCITFLARKLEKELWFLKSKPTEFDIVIYAYLTELTKIKLPNNPLESHILEFPNLVNFIDRINKKYFSDDIFQFEDQEKNSKSSGNNSIDSNAGNSHDEDKESRKTQMVSLACAVLAMVGFALSKGMLSFSYNQSDDKYIAYYDDEDNDDDDYN